MIPSLAHEFASLDADLPARPQSLVRLLALLQNPNTTMDDIAGLIETDMALASAIVRTVNSAMFGLLRRVQTVGEAVRYLGLREVAAITFETALRSAFPPTPRLEVLWQRASATGLLLGRSGAGLGLDPMLAHTAGLFERCGQAILLAKAGERYVPLLEAHLTDRRALDGAERVVLGLTHAAYGSALCASWGLAVGVVHYVRDGVQSPERLPEAGSAARRLLALGAVAGALLDGVPLEEAAAWHGPGSGCTAAELSRAVERPWSALESAWREVQPAHPVEPGLGPVPVAEALGVSPPVRSCSPAQAAS